LADSRLAIGRRRDGDVPQGDRIPAGYTGNATEGAFPARDDGRVAVLMGTAARDEVVPNNDSGCCRE